MNKKDPTKLLSQFYQDFSDAEMNESDDDVVRTDEEYYKKVTNNNQKIKHLTEDKLLKLIIAESKNKLSSREKQDFIMLTDDENNLVTIITLILNICKNKLVNLVKNEKLCVLIFIKNFFEKLMGDLRRYFKALNMNMQAENEAELKKFNIPQVDSQKITEMLNLLLHFLIGNHEGNEFSEKEKLHLIYIIKNLITINYNFTEGEGYLNNILIEINNQLNVNSTNITEKNILNYLNVYECVITSRKDLIYDDEIFDQCLFLIEFVLKNIDNIKYSDNSDEISNKRQTLERISDIIENLFKNSLHILKKEKDLSRHLFFNNQKLLKILDALLHCDNQNLSLNKSECLIKYDNDNESINPIKLGIVKRLTRAVKFLNKNCNLGTNEFFLSYVDQLCKEFLNKLSELNKSVKINTMKEENTWEVEFNFYITEIISFFNECVDLPITKDTFKSNFIEIYKFVILPLLKETVQEKEYLFSDPKEFVKIKFDTAFEFKYGQIKTKAIKLLHKLCLIFDDCLTLISSLYIEILISKFQNFLPKKVEISNNFHTVLEEFMNNKFNDDDFLENVFLVLSSLSELLFRCNRKIFDIMCNLILQIFTSNCFDEIEMQLRNKIGCLCFIIVKVKLDSSLKDESYIQNLNQNIENSWRSDLLLILLNYIFICCFSEKIKPCVNINYLYLELIDEILFNKNYLNNAHIKTLLSHVLNKNMALLDQILKKGPSESFVEYQEFIKLLSCIITHFSQYLNDEHIYTIYSTLLGLIFKEIDKNYESQLSNKKLNSNQKYLEVIGIINEILEKSFKSDKYVLIENIINKTIVDLFNNIKKTYKFAYEENLFKIINLIIRNLKFMNLDLFQILVTDYLKFIKNKKFGLKAFHVEYLIEMTKLLLRVDNKEICLRMKDEAISLFTICLNYVTKSELPGNTDHYLMCSFMSTFIFLFKNYLDINDYNTIIRYILERIRNTDAKVQPGTFANRLLFVFHMISLIVSNSELESLIKNKSNSFVFLIKKTMTLCSDQPTTVENSITLMFAHKVLALLTQLKENLTDNLDLITNLLEFIVRNLSSMTVINSIKSEKNKAELTSNYIEKNDIEKKLFGHKQNRENNMSVDKSKDSSRSSKDSLNQSNSDYYNESDFDELEEGSSYFFPEEDEEDEEDIFLLDLDVPEQLREFNKKMTAEKFVERKKKEYSIKINQNKFPIDTYLIENQEFVTILNNRDEFDLIRNFMEGIYSSNQNVYHSILDLLPNYIRELMSSHLKGWKKVKIEEKEDEVKKPRKIMTIKREGNINN